MKYKPSWLVSWSILILSAPRLIRYPTAMAIFFLAIAIRFVTFPINSGVEFITFYPALVIIALLCGSGPCFLAIIVGSFLNCYLFMEPFGVFNLKFEQIMIIITYIISGYVIFLIVHQMRIIVMGQFLLSAIVENSDDAIISKTLSGIITSWNPSAERLFGYSASEAIGRPMTIIFPADRYDEEQGLLARMSRGENVYRYETVRRHKDGHLIEVSVNLSPIKDLHGHIIGASKIAHDITAHKMLENRLRLANEELNRLSRIDALTGAANRRWFDELLETEWTRSARSKTPISLLLIDVDYFKLYNDHYGHPAGDTCLKMIVEAITHVVRHPPDVVARYGGEEFVCLLPGADLAGIINIGERILEEVRNHRFPHAFSSVAEHITVSIGGVSWVPDGKITPGALIEAADRNLYRAKNEGRNRLVTG